VSTGDVYGHGTIATGTAGAVAASLSSGGQLVAGNGKFQVAANGVVSLAAQGASGANCSLGGGASALTVDSAGVLLSCDPASGVWRPVGGRQQKQSFYIASDGAVIPSPGCPATASPEIVVVPSAIYIDTTAAISFVGPGSGPWVVQIRDGSNAPVAGATAQVETYCAFS
jgi:hypothetical protein